MQLNIYYNDDYTASPENFETTTKSKAIVNKIIQNHDGRLNIVDPKSVIAKPHVDELIMSTHENEYIQALKTGNPKGLAMSSGFEWGESTYDFALSHTHGVVSAVKSVIDFGGRAGTLSSGLHHASPLSGSGFCTINGLAVGSLYAVLNNRKAIILDFDAHCGGGTMDHINRMTENEQINDGDIVQIDLSVSGFDKYVPRIPTHYMRLVSLETKTVVENDGEVVSSDDAYIDWIADALVAAEMRYRDDMVIIYNAGIDPINVANFDDALGVIRRREELVSSWIGDKPAVFTLAGGYKWNGFTMDDIADGHLINIDTWARHMAKVYA